MKTVVITGAGSGIGLALAKRYVSLGYRVIATKLENQETPFKSDHIEFVNVNFLEDNLQAWMNTLPKEIDVFIANAGAGSYEENSIPKQNDPLYRLNTLTPINQYFLLKNNAFKGTFVVMGSVMAIWPLPGYARFSHTKGALVTYFKALQATDNIPIVIMLPVAIKTKFFETAKQAHAPWLAQNPDTISKKMIKVIHKQKRVWISSKLFTLLYKISPSILRFYLKRENKIYQTTFNEEQ